MDSHRLLRSVLSGLNDIEEWRLGNAALAAAKGYPREFPAELSTIGAWSSWTSSSRPVRATSSATR
jgi:hypothetical protein